MIGVDTNILVRVALEDDASQSKIAERFIDEHQKKSDLFISSYAILEMVWVLKSHHFDRADIHEVLLDLIDSPGITIGQKEVVIRAAELYALGKADFGDYMILAEGQLLGAKMLISFDKLLCKTNSDCINLISRK